MLTVAVCVGLSGGGRKPPHPRSILRSDSSRYDSVFEDEEITTSSNKRSRHSSNDGKIVAIIVAITVAQTPDLLRAHPHIMSC